MGIPFNSMHWRTLKIPLYKIQSTKKYLYVTLNVKYFKGWYWNYVCLELDILQVFVHKQSKDTELIGTNGSLIAWRDFFQTTFI